MSSQQPSWMQWVTNGWPAWPTTISGSNTGKTNIDADALLRVSWLGCMPDDSGTHLQVMAAAVWAMQEATLEGPTSPIEAYSCDMHVLESMQDSQQVACMSIKGWHQADPTLSLVIARLWDGTLGWWQSKQTDPPKCNQFLWERNHLQLWKGVLYWRARSRESEETLFQLVLLAACRDTALRGCHNEVGHLGLKWMLDLMCGQFCWPQMAAQAKEHINKCHPCLTFKAKQPKALLQNIMAMHPLELVHLDNLCLGSWRGLEENVLVVTDHFTWYAQAYITWSQTAKTTAKAIWDNFIVHYGIPKKILLDQGRHFESQLVADLCRVMGAQKLWTSPYHSKTNG